MAKERLCAVSACGKLAYRRKVYCQGHWRRLQRHGDLAEGTPLGQWQPAAPARDWIDEHRGYTGDDCLFWPFKRDRRGYAQISIEKSTHIASRLMCELVYGAAPTDEHQAAHSCGNGHLGCMTPKHLRWATPEENYADRRGHGTDDVGERNPRSILTEDDVRVIRRLEGSVSRADLAKRFNVSRSTIAMAQRGDNWGGVEG